MKRLGTIYILTISVVAILLFATTALGKEWYVGGTLHKATVREWHSASYANKLATSADFATTGSGSRNLTEIKIMAIQLEECITESSNDPRLYGQDVANFAVLCLYELGYKH
ncbi:MAG: hypothetical protein GXP38_03320 [Chloroflexi bacterium]|nr:hypothetical protein [Chloroflexota bacterium]